MTEKQRPEVSIDERRNTALRLFGEVSQAVIKNNPKAGDIVQDSRLRIEKAFDDFAGSSEKLSGRANSAFLVHTRRYEGSHPQLDDSGRCFPALKHEYGAPEPLVEKLWNQLPPFQVGTIEGSLNGNTIDCALISVPITPTKLYDAANGQNPMEAMAAYATEPIMSTVNFANKLGVQKGVIGLGETLASLTWHGQLLKDTYPSNEFATGHAFTTHLIREWVKESGRMKEKDLSDASVTILGAAGSIGNATMELLAEEGVRRVTLYDLEGKEEKMVEKANRFGLETASIITGENNLEQACKRSEIIVSGVSALRPIVEARHLTPGSIYIDDSQPPSVWRESANAADASLLWVVGKLPQSITRNDFDYGIRDGEWGCAMEVVAKMALGDDKNRLQTVGRVTSERVKIAGEIANELGFGLAAPQSFGELTHVRNSPTTIFHRG